MPLESLHTFIDRVDRGEADPDVLIGKDVRIVAPVEEITQ
jgi:hypothetical protein